MTDVFGWVAAAIGIASSMPQLLRILRERNSAGVSLPLWQTTAGTGAAWAAHGFLTGAAPLQVPNLLGSLLAFATVIFVLKNRLQPVLRQLVLPLLLGAALIAVDLKWGAVVFGILIVMPQLAGQLSQLRALITTTNPAGVSAGFLAIFVAGQIMWLVYGVLHGDWALIIAATTMVVIASLNLSICLIRQARARKLALAV